MLSVRLAPELMERLQTLADKTGRTKSFYAREAIARYLEDMADTVIAIERLQTPAKRWTLHDLENPDSTQPKSGYPPRGTPGKDLLQFAGTISPDDLEAMKQAIEEGCERSRGPEGITIEPV
jgi:RHH-type transcriptional regulator, rel operon repressor / antitoxin RelB